MMWAYFFVVVFTTHNNEQFSTSMEYSTPEKCLIQQDAAEKNPSLLYFDVKYVKGLEYGCVKRKKNT